MRQIVLLLYHINISNSENNLSPNEIYTPEELIYKMY